MMIIYHRPYLILAGLILLGLALLAVQRIFCHYIRATDAETPQTFTYVPRARANIVRFSHLDRVALLDYALPRLLDHLGDTDVLELSRRARLFARLNPLHTRAPSSEMAQLLERQLYGWVRGPKYASVADVARGFGGGGQGIVISTGNHYFRFAVHLIRSLQHFNCTLPVEVWHNGPRDLNAT